MQSQVGYNCGVEERNLTHSSIHPSRWVTPYFNFHQMHIIVLFRIIDPLEFKLVRYSEIHQLYAKRYDVKKFKGYMQTILKNYKNGTQQFKEKVETEAWSTRNKKSIGWHLLYDLLIETDSRAKLKTMSLQEIHESNPNFQCYSIDKFTKYYNDMIIFTGKRLISW